QRLGRELIAEAGLVSAGNERVSHVGGPVRAGHRPAPIDAGETLEYAAADLVALDAFEQCGEVAFAEALVALALDDLEEDRTDAVLGEDLQQLALVGFRIGID